MANDSPIYARAVSRSAVATETTLSPCSSSRPTTLAPGRSGLQDVLSITTETPRWSGRSSLSFSRHLKGYVARCTVITPCLEMARIQLVLLYIALIIAALAHRCPSPPLYHPNLQSNDMRLNLLPIPFRKFHHNLYACYHEISPVHLRRRRRAQHPFVRSN